MKDPDRALKKIEDVIDTRRTTAPAVNGKFVRKRQFETDACHSASYSNINFVIHAFLGFAIPQPNI